MNPSLTVVLALCCWLVSPRHTLAQTQRPGSVDLTFLSTGSEPPWNIGTMLVQPDGNILVGGNFRLFNGIGRNFIARVVGGFDPVFELPSATSLSTDGFQLTLTSMTNQQHGIEASTNLLDWTLLTTLTNLSGTLQFVDPEAMNFNRRFYRTVMLPQP